MQEDNRCLTCGDEIPNGRLYCLSCIEESELECEATEWIRNQGWDEETLPNDEYIQMKEAYIAGAKQYKEKYKEKCIDMNKTYQDLVNGWVIDYRELGKENEQLKEMLRSLREKLFNILSEYEIGNYDSNIHQFYKDVYDIHNELMELAE